MQIKFDTQTIGFSETIELGFFNSASEQQIISGIQIYNDESSPVTLTNIQLSTSANTFDVSGDFSNIIGETLNQTQSLSLTIKCGGWKYPNTTDYYIPISHARITINYIQNGNNKSFIFYITAGHRGNKSVVIPTLEEFKSKFFAFFGMSDAANQANFGLGFDGYTSYLNNNFLPFAERGIINQYWHLPFGIINDNDNGVFQLDQVLELRERNPEFLFDWNQTVNSYFSSYPNAELVIYIGSLSRDVEDFLNQVDNKNARYMITRLIDSISYITRFGSDKIHVGLDIPYTNAELENSTLYKLYEIVREFMQSNNARCYAEPRHKQNEAHWNSVNGWNRTSEWRLFKRSDPALFNDSQSASNDVLGEVIVLLLQVSTRDIISMSYMIAEVIYMGNYKFAVPPFGLQFADADIEDIYNKIVGILGNISSI